MKVQRLTFLGELRVWHTLSPDGRRFAVSTYHDLYVGNVDGSDVQRISSDGPFLAPSFSPDGSRIVCSDGSQYYEADNLYDLSILDTSTGSKHRLTDTGDETKPVFSPDGTIVFVSRKDGAYNISRLRPETAGMPQLTHAKSRGNTVLSTYEDPVPSPDGESIYCKSSAHSRSRMSAPEVYRIDFDGGMQQRLTFTDGKVCEFLVSPDGTRIAFSVYAGERTPGHPAVDIWLMNADGTDQKMLDEGVSVNFFGSFSPDGKSIAISSSRERIPQANRSVAWRIYLISTVSGEASRLTESNVADKRPLFSRSGDEIVFVSNRDGPGDLYLLTAFR